MAATDAGRAHVSRPDGGGALAGAGLRGGELSDRQEEVLRYLVRQTGPVPEDHLDGRVLRALRAQGLIVERAGWVSPSDAARGRLETHVERSRSRRHMGTPAAANARAEAILRAVEMIERALPRDAEIDILGVPAYADDVLAALRGYVKGFESGLSPTRRVRRGPKQTGIETVGTRAAAELKAGP